MANTKAAFRKLVKVVNVEPVDNANEILLTLEYYSTGRKTIRPKRPNVRTFIVTREQAVTLSDAMRREMEKNV